MWSLDARIPLTILADQPALMAAVGGGDAAVLLAGPPVDLPAGLAVERFDASAAHAVACSCCGGRTPAATALDRLFQARVRGTVPWFRRVLAFTPGAEAAVRAAVEQDTLARARFRLG